MSNVMVNITARTARKAAQALLVASLKSTAGRPGLSTPDKVAALDTAARYADLATVLLSHAVMLINSGKPSEDYSMPEDVAKISGLFVPPVVVPDTIPTEWDLTADVDGTPHPPIPDDAPDSEYVCAECGKSLPITVVTEIDKSHAESCSLHPDIF